MTGIVSWGAAPIPGTRVELRSPGSTWDSGEVYTSDATGANGVFTLVTDRAGDVVLVFFPPEGEYTTNARWRTISIPSSPGSPQTLSLEIPEPFSKRMEIVGPTGGSFVASARPVFEWVAFPGAVEYRLHIFFTSGGAGDLIEVVRTTSTSTQPSHALAGGSYQWRVDAYGETSDIFAIAEGGADFTLIAP